jgi:predicted RNA-binding protein YlqC (UPF0109 family)
MTTRAPSQSKIEVAARLSAIRTGTMQVGNPEFEGLLEIPPGGSQDLVLKVNLPGNMIPLTSRQCSTYAVVDRRKFQQQNQQKLDVSDADSHKAVVSRLIEANVAKEDLGRVIGKQGRTAKSILNHR